MEERDRATAAEEFSKAWLDLGAGEAIKGEDLVWFKCYVGEIVRFPLIKIYFVAMDEKFNVRAGVNFYGFDDAYNRCRPNYESEVFEALEFIKKMAHLLNVTSRSLKDSLLELLAQSSHEV